MSIFILPYKASLWYFSWLGFEKTCEAFCCSKMLKQHSLTPNKPSLQNYLVLVTLIQLSSIYCAVKSNKFWNRLNHIHNKGSFKSGRRGGEECHWKANKNKQGKGGPSMCVRSVFFLKMLGFSKWSFTVILQFFLLIIMAVRNIKQTIMEVYNIQSCQWMACDRFLRPTQDHNVDYVKNTHSLLVNWISTEGCGKTKFEQPFFLRSVSQIMKTIELEKFTFNLNCSHQNN